MRHAFLLTVRFVIPLILLHFSWASDRKTYPLDIPAGAVSAISFDVQEGEFVLRGDPTVTSVKMRVSIDRLWVFRLGEEGILRRLINVSGQGTNQLKIATDIPRSLANWGRAEYPIDFEVVVPAGIPVQIRDTSGTIRISQLDAPVDVHDGSGTLVISDIHGAVTVVKESGDIQVERVSDLTRITSKTGQVKLHELAGLEVEKSEGNVDVVHTGSARIRNKGGNLRVSDVKGTLEIEDESGEIQIADVEGDVKIRDTSGQIRASHVGAVTIDDTDGDITVRQATSLLVRQKESGQVKVLSINGSVEVPPKIHLHQE
jgi:hypothetical protein